MRERKKEKKKKTFDGNMRRVQSTLLIAVCISKVSFSIYRTNQIHVVVFL